MKIEMRRSRESHLDVKTTYSIELQDIFLRAKPHSEASREAINLGFRFHDLFILPEKKTKERLCLRNAKKCV